MTVKEFLESGINYNGETIFMVERVGEEIEFDESLEVLASEFNPCTNEYIIEVA